MSSSRHVRFLIIIIINFFDSVSLGQDVAVIIYRATNVNATNFTKKVLKFAHKRQKGKGEGRRGGWGVGVGEKGRGEVTAISI